MPSPRRPLQPRATLGQIRKQTPWLWVTCAAQGCGHHRPIALAPLLFAGAPTRPATGVAEHDFASLSHEIAKRVIYGRLPHLPGQLPETYEAEALPIVNEQIERAGVRLAALLNATLK